MSVFETNIRILGGLISAHLLASESPQLLPEYDGKMLDLAIDIADRLMPAFQTKTGIPYGTVKRFLFHSLLHLTLKWSQHNYKPILPFLLFAMQVNLRYGVPPQETEITSTAGAGTFILEFGLLSRLTGNNSYEVAHFSPF